ncbi:MAG: rod shape-determining protein MreC [Bacillota bacterium]
MFQLFVNRRFLIIALIFLLITWVMFVSSHRRGGEGKIEYFFNTAMVPLESLFNNFSGAVDNSWKTVTSLAQLKVENERLLKEIADLKARQLGLNSLKAENDRLRAALNFQANQPNELIAAEIITVNPNNWNQTITINRGRNYNLKKNMAVITPQGVVGRIGEVRAGTAEVILITDPREGNFIGGVVSRTRNLVIVTGGGQYRGECTVQPAVDSYFMDLRKKDLIVTAETSEIFPRGLPIGRVVYVDKTSNQMVSKASLKPAVNLGKLQIVYVIKNKKELPVDTGTSEGPADARTNP